MKRRSRLAALRNRDWGGPVAALGVSGVELQPDRASAESIATPNAAVFDLIFLPETEERALFAAKQVSPGEALEAQIAQLETPMTDVDIASAPGASVCGDTLAGDRFGRPLNIVRSNDR